MKIQLTKTTPIPDETWKPSKEHPVQPVATNYAGAELEVSKELADRLVGEGCAVILGAPVESGEAIGPDTTGEKVTRTFLGGRG
jgi:hypothetical protein